MGVIGIALLVYGFLACRYGESDGANIGGSVCVAIGTLMVCIAIGG